MESQKFVHGDELSFEVRVGRVIVVIARSIHGETVHTVENNVCEANGLLFLPDSRYESSFCAQLLLKGRPLEYCSNSFLHGIFDDTIYITHAEAAFSLSH